MMRCNDCQPLLLDHLYGLLDPADAAAVEGHLSGCSGCAAARDIEAWAQGLFARAARTEFPHVRFVPPAEEPAAPELASPARTDREVPTPRRFAIGPVVGWAIAASVLVGVIATGSAVDTRTGRVAQDRAQATAAAARETEARGAVEHLTRELAGKRGRLAAGVDAAKRTHDQVLADWVAAEKASLAAPTDRRLAVRVTKPAVLQPGAANSFELAVTDTGPVPFDEPIHAEVRDQAGTVVFTETFDPARGGRIWPIRLPAEVWAKVRPDDELFLAVATVDPRTRTKTDLQEPIRLYGPVFATLLVTDRPGYRPGDPVHFRSLTLDRVSFRPPSREQHLRFELTRKADRFPVATVEGSTSLIRVADGAVEPVTGPDGKPIRGVGCGTAVLPPDLPDGEYVLTVTELSPPNGAPPVMMFPVTRTITVRSAPRDKYQKHVAFAAAGFAPGEVAEGWAELKQQDRPVQGAPVVVVALDANNTPLAVGLPQQVTDADGRVRFGVSLPRVLPPGDVRVKVMFGTAERQTEEAAARVPVIGRNLTVEFFPEGGTLAAGVPCRVYVRATTIDGRPAEIRGVVIDGQSVVTNEQGEPVRVETIRDPNEPGLNRGLGSFTFTPKLGTKYWLKLEAPSGPVAPMLPPDKPEQIPAGVAAVAGIPAALAARTGFALPEVGFNGVVMTVMNPVTAPGQPFRVRLYSVGMPRTLVIGAYTRGRPSDLKTVRVPANRPTEVELMGGNDPRGGVTRITVFDDRNPPNGNPKLRQDLMPVAERLVFRKPGEVLNLAVTRGDGSPIGPQPGGTPVELEIRATDEAGNPTPAVLFAAVTNAGGTVSARDRLLPTQFLIAGEVQHPDDLEYADFLLTDDPRAAGALDRVLATQGWRRFVEQFPVAPKPDPKPAVGVEARRPELDNPRDRLLAMNGAFPVALDPAETRGQQVFENHYPKYEAAANDLQSARAAKAAADGDSAAHNRATDLLRQYEARCGELDELTRTAEAEAGEVANHARKWPFAAGLGVVFAAIAGFLAVRRAGLTRVIPFSLSAVGLIGLAVYLTTHLEAGSPAVGPTDRTAIEVPPATLAPPTTPMNGPNLGADPAGGGLVRAKTHEPIGPRTVDKNPPKVDTPVPEPKEFNPNPLVNPMAVQTPAVVQKNWTPDPEARKVISRDLFRPAVDQRTLAPKSAPRLAAPGVARSAGFDRINELTRARQKEAWDVLPTTDADVPAAARVRAAVSGPTPLVIREYAAPRPTALDGADEPDTVLWQPVIVLPTDGRAVLTFNLGNSPAGYEVMVGGHTPDGRIGATRRLVPVSPTSPK